MVLNCGLHCVLYTTAQERDVVLQIRGLTWMQVAKQQSLAKQFTCSPSATPWFMSQGCMQWLFVLELSH